VIPPAQTDRTHKRTKQVLLGSGIGVVASLLICLLLLLLLTYGGFGRGGRGMAGRGGQGSGPGAGHGQGSGTGKGAGTGSGEGAGGTQQAEGGGIGRALPSPAGDAAKAMGAGGNQQGQRGAVTGSGQDEDIGRTALREYAVQEVPERVAVAAGGTSPGTGPADGSGRLAGGGGGSDYSQFFGLRTGGSKFVYVIDCSGSMRPHRIVKAKAELIQSLKQLKPSQSAYVFFFAQISYPMFGPHDVVETKMLKCTKDNVRRMEQWIDQFDMSGGTFPRQSLLDAIDLAPDAIFFLTDGIFDAQTADDVRQHNHARKRPVSINTICFVDRSGEPVMQRIATENKGDYRFVP
jgi:hypothetical protein